jgi:GBP family porin
MKKSLIALAVLGAMSSAAFAQSSVTIYGIVDIGLNWNKQGTLLPGATATTQESGFSVDSGNQSGSRLGFRGSEALGRNWNAVFTLEAGYDLDTGMSGQSGRLFGRQAYAGLQHSAFGTFALGRFAAPSSGTGDFDLFGKVDPFGTGFSPIGLQATFIPANSQRFDNGVLWASPSWAGFKFAAMYSTNINGADTTPSGTNTSAFDISAQWSWGPLFVAATYDVYNFANCYGAVSTTGVCTTAGNRAGAGNPDQKMLQLGAVFDLKFMKIHGAYANQDNISLVGGAGAANTTFPAAFNSVARGYYNNQAYMLGLTFNLLGGSLFGSYQWSDADNIINGLAQFEPDYNVWGIGYTYNFSRRTNMYAAYGQRAWDGSVRSTTGVLLTSAAQTVDRDFFTIGIRHLF